jgi:mannan endo-1,4-beta-mannosidase
MKRTRVMVFVASIIAFLVIALISSFNGGSSDKEHAHPVARPPGAVLRGTGAYLGVYAPGAPKSYDGVTAFTATTGVRPGVVVYYSGWLEPFQTRFAATVASHDALPLVQIDPTGVSLTAIASGQYDAYLHSYASAVKAFGGRVILSFGHEMNGYWYSWGYHHTSPAAFVAAWRHIVTVFRAAGARYVTWLWAVNIMNRHGIPSMNRHDIPSPKRWWPGSSYVNWVGIDGYYYKPSWKFASLFGPTIKAVRALTLAPIFITETSVARSAGQPAKVADLFAGIRAYGLLGFVWFDAKGHRDWRISNAAASAFRRGAETLERPAS